MNYEPDIHTKAKARWLQQEGLRECCGIVYRVGEECKCILCPINKEKERLKNKE